MSSILHLQAVLDRTVLWLLAPLALAILVSGLDDLVIDLFWIAAWLKARLRPEARLFPPGERQLASAPRQKIAMLIPLWQEHEVIEKMLEHNLASIRYDDYQVFAGCYPNDPLTEQALRAASRRFPHLHIAVCPHDGPTSKADCLNWIFQHLRREEQQQGQRFDVIVVHDAEDLVHPEELRWVNYYSARFDFVQTPVLPLPTPFRKFTHGIYCDEFAEYHTRDMMVRPLSGGFVPSCGVGTGYRREALEKLALAESNRIFEPAALTEDYVNGLVLFRLGAKQTFVPLFRNGGGAKDWMATRELFPQTWSAALRQRTRWVTGISLQGWQRFGWSGKPGEVYWLWRDRKGLLGNPLSCLANLVFVYGLATHAWTRATPATGELAIATLTLQALRTGVRMLCCGRVYGIRFALGVPLRAVYANALNSAATFQALARYAWARALKRPLRWLKTDHAYPSHAILRAHKRPLGEILTANGVLSGEALSAALSSLPAGVRLGEHLVNSGRLTIEALYESLSLQQGLPLASFEPPAVSAAVARVLPQSVVEQWKVLPFRVAEGGLFLAGPEIPTAAMNRALQGFTALELKFHLVTPGRFAALSEALL